MLKFKTEKNKTFAPKRQGNFDIYVADSKKGFQAGQIDRLKEVVIYAVYWGVIKRAGAWYKILENDEWKFQGSEKVLEFLRDNDEARELVEGKVMAIALNTKRANSDEPETLVTDEGYEIDPETGEIISEGNI